MGFRFDNQRRLRGSRTKASLGGVVQVLAFRGP